MFAKKPSIFKRILKAALIVLITLVLGVLSCLLYEWYLDYLERPADVLDEPTVVQADIILESGVTYKSGITKNRAVFCSSESIKFIDSSGANTSTVQTAVSNPVISTAGDYLLVSDKGSKKAKLYKNEKEIAVFELEGSIICASVCEAGLCVFVTKGELHKCSVVVLNMSGEEIFKWNSGGLSVLAADISHNGEEICVSTLNTDDGVLKSNIIMFNTGKDKPFTNDVYEGLIFASCEYESNYVYVIGDSVTHIYNSYGKLLGTIDYSERKLLTYDCYKNNLVLVFSNSTYLKGGCLIENYDTSGKMLGRYELGGDIKYIDVYGSSIAVNSGNAISVLDLKCRERKNVMLKNDIRDFMFFGSENLGVGVSGAGVNIINVK